ncbi:amidase family protein [Microbacterium sp. HJ5]
MTTSAPDLGSMSAAALAAGVHAGRWTASDLCAAAIARIEAYDGHVNAVVVREFETALTEAAATDEAWARGDVDSFARPLLGVPITVKESFDLRGRATTWGSEAFRHHRAESDAVPVRRLKEAGAIVIGKTNVPVWLDDWQSDNPIYGRTRNPYDLARTPGGSSGGSAAALAAGYTALELGSDIGGSIRVPAAFCGVFGHKPSWNLLAAEGHAPGGLAGVQPPLAVIGPLARSAGDLALAVELLAGPDEFSPANRLDLPQPRHTRLRDFRVLALDTHPEAATSSAVKEAVQDAADRAVAAGATVSWSSELFPDLAEVLELYRTMLRAVGSRRGRAGSPSLPVREWFELLDRQLSVRRQWVRLFDEFDVVIAPVYGTVAFPLSDEPDNDLRRIDVDGSAEPYVAQLAWPSIASFANLPATAAPVGLSADGLPLSVQVIAGHLDDLTAITFAGLIALPTPPPVMPGPAALPSSPN